ncbi:MAG: hypothetical protein HOI96_09125 [Rhodospirillaceae bacterium]|nr:hypothetical protein [Rhodospirillaceae bacterium]
MMRPILKILVVFGGLSVLPVAANALVFTDETAFQAAAGGVVVETFESYGLLDPVAALSGLHLTFSPLSNGSAPSAYDQSLGGVAQSGMITLMNNDKLGLPGLGSMEIIADPGTEFLAFGYWNVGGDDTTRLTLFDVNDNLIESAVTSTDDPAFIGIIGAVGATRAVIEAVQGNGWFTIDDIQVDAASVPMQVNAPGGLAVMFLGLLFLRRRPR